MSVAPPTLAGLKKHFDKYGVEKMKGGYRKPAYVDKKYRSWATLKDDSLLEVALFFLPINDVLKLVKHMTNEPKIIAQFKDEYGEALLDDKGHTKRSSVSRPGEHDGTEVSGTSTERGDSRRSRSRTR